MLDILHKYRFHIGFSILFVAGISMCVAGIVVPVLIPIGAALIGGALGMLSQSLSKMEAHVELNVPNVQTPAAEAREGETHAERRESVDRHDVHNSYTVNNNGPVTYMYSQPKSKESTEENHSKPYKLELI